MTFPSDQEQGRAAKHSETNNRAASIARATLAISAVLIMAGCQPMGGGGDGVVVADIVEDEANE